MVIYTRGGGFYHVVSKNILVEKLIALNLFLPCPDFALEKGSVGQFLE